VLRLSQAGELLKHNKYAYKAYREALRIPRRNGTYLEFDVMSLLQMEMDFNRMDIEAIDFYTDHLKRMAREIELILLPYQKN